jgi:GxxExxY protein
MRSFRRRIGLDGHIQEVARMDPEQKRDTGGRRPSDPARGADGASEQEDGRDAQTAAIIGAAMEVHNELGHGFHEPVYQEAMEVELELRGIPFVREVALPVYYKGRLLKSSYRPDFLCFGEVITELKALAALTTTEYAQVLNYLKASNLQRGLLLNLGTPRMEMKRFVHSPQRR